jgi:hypothetical protein
MRKKASVIGVFHLTAFFVVCTACDEEALLDAEVAEHQQTPDDADSSTEFRAMGCARVYWDGSFQGIHLDIPDGAFVSWIGDQWSDDVSSAIVNPGCALNVWEHGSFGGKHKTVAGVVPWIGGDWNDIISAWTCDC